MVFVWLVGGLRHLALLLKSKQLASYGQELSLKRVFGGVLTLKRCCLEIYSFTCNRLGQLKVLNTEKKYLKCLSMSESSSSLS